MTQLKPFEASEYLTNEDTISEFLTASLEDPNPDVFLRACKKSPRPVVCRSWPVMQA